MAKSKVRDWSEYDSNREEILELWETYPSRPVPSTTLDMYEFVSTKTIELPQLFRFGVGDFTTDQRWQLIKKWMTDYEKGKRRFK